MGECDKSPENRAIFTLVARFGSVPWPRYGNVTKFKFCPRGHVSGAKYGMPTRAWSMAPGLGDSGDGSHLLTLTVARNDISMKLTVLGVTCHRVPLRP